LDGLYETLMDLQPGVAAKETGGGYDRPELGEVLVAFAAGAAVELGFTGDVGAFFGGQWPAARLGLRRFPGVFEGKDGGTQEG
jgi:hypothetical protein